MADTRSSQLVTKSDDSPSVLKNTEKLRVGVMLDSYRIEAWEYRMLEAVIRSDYASLELVVLNQGGDEKKSSAYPMLSAPDTFFYRAYTKLEDRVSGPKPAFLPMDARDLLRNIPVLEIKPEMDKHSDRFGEQDSEKIKKFRLDVMVKRGFRMLTGDILKAAKYGVWAYHHDDITSLRGGPPGFRETFERTGERGVVLQILTDNPDNGIVLYRSFLSCYSFLVSRNNNDCFLKSSLYVPRTLQRLHDEGEEAFFTRIDRENKNITFYNHRLYEYPGNFEFIRMLTRFSYRMGAFFLPFFFFRNQWMLMYDLGDQISTSFCHFRKIIPPRDRFWADPHVFFRDDTYYIFFEEYLYKTKKGHISLIEMDQSGDYSESVKVLEEPFHLSYPHVFNDKGILCMIPETRKARSINLYQCTDFPTGWKHRATLIDSIDAVDSTVLFHNNTWWLFANVAEPDGTSVDNELHLFSSDSLLGGSWEPHPMNPIISDVKGARPAGKILERNGILYRPSQCCKPWYGYGIKLNEIVTLTKNDYAEREIAFIEPQWDKNLTGVHTLCHENRLTMIDGYALKRVKY